MEKIPINPSARRNEALHAMAGGEKPTDGVQASWAMSFPSKFFAVMLEIANVIYRTTDYKKKARIVLEYDPRQEKMTLSTFTEDAEPNEREDREFD